MATEKIQVDITAKDDASKTIHGVADAAEEVEKLSPEVAVTADTAAATSDLKVVATAAGVIDHSDTVLVIKAQIDQAKGELDTLQTKLRDVDDAAVSTGKAIGDEVETGTGKATAATHSMAGNVIGDSAAMATGFGPLGEALGQITEGALGGEVALKEMLTAGLGLAAITVVVGAIQKGLQINKDIDAFNKKKVDEFVKSLKDGKTALDQLNDAFAETGKIEFIDQADGKTKDLTHTLADAGLTMDDFLTKVGLGQAGFDKWVASAGTAIGAGAGLNAIIQAGGEFINDQAAAQVKYADQLNVSGTAASDAAREHRGLTDSVVDGSDAFAKSLEPTRKAVHQVDLFAQNSAQAEGAYRKLIGALDEQEAWANVNQAVTDYNANTDKSDANTRDLIRTVADYVESTDTIPASKKTEIFADLSSGDVSKIEADLTELTQQRDIKILLTAVGSKDTIKLLRNLGGGGFVNEAGATATAAGSTFVTVNMPRGSRGVDVVRQIAGQTRRSGRRYGVPQVNYARS